jgi:hypothetical protein
VVPSEEQWTEHSHPVLRIQGLKHPAVEVGMDVGHVERACDDAVRWLDSLSMLSSEKQLWEVNLAAIGSVSAER